ncbi:dehydrogenase/reductase SDR family member 12-like [Daphnia carinata]|uniref:dehydrogenase/reductase SDR family member 12-like n=1 Tax=Daphnia carinata TaxID=120202 RepID=UPI00257F8FA0|nr:dehydrogenase/reductase SDR family member 12-like [Daphnia carinata]
MSFYRNAVWFARGLRDYTKGGYESASKNFNPADLDLNVDCSGKSYMITGGNSGIGKCIALDIAKRGGTIHLVCRNKKSAQEAQSEIQKASGNNNVHIHPLDLSDSKSVVEFGRRFVESGTELNVLVNNAGCMINNREIDSNGNEKNFATNTLGTHLLTTSLIPLLSKATQPRVIIVSSGGMLVQKLNVDDWQLEKEKKFDGTMAYAQNKRQQVVMMEQYAKQYPNIHFSAMHPGWADTPAVRSSMPDFYEKMKDRLRTAEQGADTATWLAISEAALQFPSGLFFEDRRPVPTHLPLAWTRSTKEEEAKFMAKLAALTEQFTKN